MKYLMTLIVEEGGMDDRSHEEMKESLARWGGFNDEAIAGGVRACGRARPRPRSRSQPAAIK